MPVRRRALTAEEAGDAKRLRSVWQERSKNLQLTQLGVSQSFGFANQSAVSQYLNGRIPLNLEAALRFASILKVPVSDLTNRFDDLLRSDRHTEKRDMLGIPANDDLLVVTEDMKEIVGECTWIVIDKCNTKLSEGLFVVQIGNKASAVEVKSLGNDMFHVRGAGGTEMKIPAAATTLISVAGKVTHKFTKC